MAVILAHPAASSITARRQPGTEGEIPWPRPPQHLAPRESRRARSLLLFGLVPLLLANASWDAVTFLGGSGAHALAPAHASASACA